MNEKTKDQPGTGSLQRQESSSEETQIRQKIKAIREGHTTGGYCDTEKLKAAEKELWSRILTKRLANAKEGTAEHRDLTREIQSLAFRPKLVVAED